MERWYRDKLSARKQGGGLKDRPQCERCGRPVRVSSNDYSSEELLCPHYAADARVSGYEDQESLRA